MNLYAIIMLALLLILKYLFNAELVDNVINELKRGKAAGLDTLTAEHLQYSHPAIVTVVNKLFNLIIISGHIHPKFGMSFTVPFAKRR